MVSMKASALLLCAVAANFLFQLEGKPLEDLHQENAFDKIIKADSSYADLKDHRHEVDMVLPEVKTTRRRRGLESDPPSPIFRTVRLWPEGVIPYTLSYNLREKSVFVKLINEAIKDYEERTCLRFVKRTTQENYVEFYSGPGCQSDVGYQGGGVQQLSLGKNCDSLDIVIHEIGHAIGFYHEQNRPDRDRYIKVLEDNIQGHMRYAYKIKSGWHPMSISTPYDYYSVMHYGRKDFSKNPRLVTMKAYKSGVTTFGGNRLSALDAQRVRRMYQCPEFPDFPRDFYWSHDARGLTGQTCIKMDEPRDPYSWNDNYLCYRGQGKRPLNIRWSNSGPINGMFCTKITEPSKPSWTSWDNNYLCVPSNAPYKFKWLLSRPTSQDRKNCKKLNEPRDRYWSKGYHYLCATDRETDERDGQWSAWESWSTCTRDCGGGVAIRKRSCSNPTPANGGKSCVGEDYERQTCNTQACSGIPAFPEDFSYTYQRNSLPSGFCLRTYDLRNYFKWLHYFLCTSNSKSDPGLAWSYSGPRPGMRCTKIYNPIENKYRRGSWINNYLCVPMDSPYHFVWSINGPIKGLPCMRWYAQKGQNGWDKTYLCNQKKTRSILAFNNR